MSENPLSLNETRRITEEIDISPRKSLGQNFLIDGNIVRKSIELADLSPGEIVVEIGPGLGTLTRALLGTGALVHAVEKDPKLSKYLRETLVQEYPETFVLIEGDAMEFPLAGFYPEPNDSFKIVANLPYTISSPWLDAVLSGPLPAKMLLMLQKETVDRLSATHGTKQFSALTIFLSSAYEIERGHKVAPQCFYPIPDVDSYLFHLTRRPEPFRFEEETKKIIRECFGQRRKQIGSLLRTFAPEKAETWLAELEANGYSRKSRPEEIPTELWQKL